MEDARALGGLGTALGAWGKREIAVQYKQSLKKTEEERNASEKEPRIRWDRNK